MGIPCCLSHTSGTYTPAAVGPHPYTFNSQFVGVQVVSVRLSSGRSFPPSWWGPALLLSLGALPVRSSGLSGTLVDLPGSLLCLLPGYRSSSSQFPVVWLVLLLPSLRPYTRSLFGLLAVPPFFSLRARHCVLSWTLGFSIPLPINSSWAPLSRFSSSAASSSPRYSRWRLDPAFLLLWCASSSSLSRLVSCFCFLGWLFRAFSKFRGFLSSFSDLGFCRSQSCLGLQLFLVFLSFPLLGFPFTSSPCGVSRLLMWSLFLSVPRFL